MCTKLMERYSRREVNEILAKAVQECLDKIECGKGRKKTMQDYGSSDCDSGTLTLWSGDYYKD